MNKILIFALMVNSLLMASDDQSNHDERKSRVEKQIEIEMEKEKKYSIEQTFYTEENYDFKGAEVNPDSLLSIPVLEPQDDFDMDSVYD